MKKKIQFTLTIFILLFVLGFFAEKLFHHSFEKFILSALQRIDYQPDKFSKRITIVDTSPIFDLSKQRTDRTKLAELLHAVKLGQPEGVGLDIRLEPDSLHKDVHGDSLLKAILMDWENIVIPDGADPYFSIKDSSRLANIQIHDGYELLVAKDGYLSLPFCIASNQNIDIPQKQTNFIVNYRMTFKDLSDSEQFLSADELLKIYNNSGLSIAEKQDRLAMILASQFVFIGFCNDALNIDRHDTPFGKQAGIVIWANAFDNILQNNNIIHYNPSWGIVIWLLTTALVILYLNYLYRKFNFYYSISFILISLIQIFLWSFVGAYIYFSSYNYLPIFSFLFVTLIVYPMLVQLIHFSKMIEIAVKYPKIFFVPDPMKTHYINYLKENNMFKQLHFSFTLVEECVRFIVFLGLAQAMSFNINLKNILKNKEFNKLTFGEWQGLLRDISIKLINNNKVIDEWKMLYYDKINNREWIRNDLSIDLDGEENKNIIDRLEGDKYDMEEKLQILAGETSWIKKILYFILRILYFSYSESSKNFAMKIKKRFNNVRHLIDIRNGLVHHGGVFMEDKDYKKLHGMFKSWLERFLTKRMKFWRYAFLNSTSNDGTNHLYIEIDNKKFTIDPFFQVEICPYHKKDELFFLSEIDKEEKQITYRGIGPNCWFIVENAFKEGDRMSNFLKLYEK